jgi:hypothetical protein
MRKVGSGKLFFYIAGLAVSIGIIFLLHNSLQQVAKAFEKKESNWKRHHIKIGDVESLQLWSPDFTVDRLFPSMTGPAEVHYFRLKEKGTPELLWLTGYSTSVLNAKNGEFLDDEFLCHNNFDYAINDYYLKWGLPERSMVQIPRLATITQGQTKIQFPDGFGIPMMSDQNLSTATQVLNVNLPDTNFKVKHLVEIDYISERKAKQSVRPLFQQSVNVLVKVDTNAAISDTLSPEQDCRPALSTIAFLSTRKDGELYTGHWVIPKGRDTITYDVTYMLNLPFSTTLHYAGVHVHPYCEYLELRDVTENKVVFRSNITNDANLSKMNHIEAFSSIEGLLMHKEHQYELVCVTNNTTDMEQDMMAVMLLYLHDKELEEIINKKK